MLLQIARFEIRYLLRNPVLWVSAAAVFALLFVSISTGVELGSEGGLLHNAAYATVRNYTVLSIFFMFVTTSFVANAVIRDDETGFGPIVRSTRIGRTEYLMGRYLGALAVATLCLCLVPLGIWLATLMPWADAARLGPNRLSDHLFGFFLIALPNILLHSALFFALATLTRSMMATYLGVIGLVCVHFLMEGAFAGRPRLASAVALADPFGARAIRDATRYWTIAERNVMLPEFSGTLLYNRLLWTGIALLCLALACGLYRFADRGLSRRERNKLKGMQQAALVSAAPAFRAAAALPSPRPGGAALRAMLWMRTRFEARQVIVSPAFPVLMAWGLFTTFISLTLQRDPDGRPTYPTTLSLIPDVADGLFALPLIVAIYYAGELVWRERDRRMHELVDAAPIPNWTYVASKTAAMGVVLCGILLTGVVSAVILQLSMGFTELELGKYLLWYVLPVTWDVLLLAALAMFVHAVSPHKVVGWGIMVLFMVGQEMNTLVDHNLLLYGGTPGMPLSDLNGAGGFWKGPWTFRLYWGAFAVLLLVAAHVLWRRGTEARLRPRLASAGQRLGGAPGWVAAAALAVFTTSGAYAFYNANVLNGYQTEAAQEAEMAAFEKKYARSLELPQPEITALTLDVALYPRERRAVSRGRYRVRNGTRTPISEIHLRTFGEDMELVRATVSGARLRVDDARYAYRIYRLDRPMAPGEEREVAFETRMQVRGFRNGAPNTKLVENGTFLNESQLMPLVGAGRAGTLQDPEARRKHGLPEVPRTPKLEDAAATMAPGGGRAWATSDITLSTSADQTPVAPGNKVSDVVRGGRRIARFVSGAPVHPRFSIQSARYAERHRRHAGVDLVVYHHPAHAWNVERMLDAMAASLDYYRAHFGPYPFDHARIVEFPGYADFAQAFAGTVPYSETVGFISDYDEPETIDYVTFMTAHELAHQYWGHQLAGADMEGREVLSETLAQYSALVVAQRMYGEDGVRRALQYQLDAYLGGRRYLGYAEPPLVRVDGQNHITYRKGAVVMFLLQKRLGEEAVNRALRSLLARYRFQGAPYPRSMDLVDALRAEADTPEKQALITDLFERVTIYHLEAMEPTAVRRADGRWDVTVPVEARKFYVDGRGVEAETPLNERIEIGLFTAEPGRDSFAARNVIRMERHPIRSGR
ncbi:MAG TPA: M1 family aminopeptidase, partial [Longimicrobium sp.]|uniref:ABC transporter permease/M1 family aminopeptidase n=1 Tax=Longimicrobium sp. TaxID=2029185 RepID=UPI002ED99178